MLTVYQCCCLLSSLTVVDKVQEVSQHQGKIVVVFEDPSSDILEIPYEATVLQGFVLKGGRFMSGLTVTI